MQFVFEFAPLGFFFNQNGYDRVIVSLQVKPQDSVGKNSFLWVNGRPIFYFLCVGDY